MRSLRLGLIAAGWVTFVISLGLVAIDSDTGGDFLRGFGMRGYQCFLGTFLAPLARPAATPLWLILAVGNLAALAAPALAIRKGPGRWSRAVLTLAAVGATAVYLLGDSIGVVRTYPGYYVWCGALTGLAIAFWLPSRASAQIPNLQSDTGSS